MGSRVEGVAGQRVSVSGVGLGGWGLGLRVQG